MSRRSYLFVYSDDLGTREQVKDYIDSVREIVNWRYELPNSFFLVSDLSAHDLAQKIRAFSKDKGKFIISELTSNKQGWLVPKTWKIINEKALPDGEPS